MEKAERALAGLTLTQDDAGRTVHSARSLLWLRDKARAQEALSKMQETSGRFALTHRMLRLIVTGDKEEFYQDFESREAMARARGKGRRSMFFAQVTAEVGAFANDRAMTLEYLSAGVEAGLIDLLWLDRCPLFDAMRMDMAFRTMRARIEERSRAIGEAYRSG
jgi:serine/threonine-protein kinase